MSLGEPPTFISTRRAKDCGRRQRAGCSTRDQLASGPNWKIIMKMDENHQHRRLWSGPPSILALVMAPGAPQVALWPANRLPMISQSQSPPRLQLLPGKSLFMGPRKVRRAIERRSLIQKPLSRKVILFYKKAIVLGVRFGHADERSGSGASVRREGARGTAL